MRAGHPWIFESSVRSVSRPGGAGDVAVVFDRKNRFLAVGLFDPEGPIRVRVLASGRPERVDAPFLGRRVEAAMARRRGLLDDPSTTGIRLVSGENDGLAGLVADLYGRVVVLEAHSLAWIQRAGELLSAFREAAAPEGLLLLPSRRVAASPLCPPRFGRPALLEGTLPPEGVLPFLERGLRFEAHPLAGHKTGFYLDQRDNRARVEELAGGRRVLDVFCHTGAFSLAAARGGAREILGVDASGPALSQARRHFELNRDDPRIAGARHGTVEGDAFREMARLAREGASFDLVIVDPPSFARETSQVPGALEAYGRLTGLALAVLRTGGILVQASCSGRVAEVDFFAAIHARSRRAGRPLREIARTGHPVDHPVDFEEGRYLKCLFATVEGR